MSALRKTFLNELCDIYDAEKQLLQAFPKMADAAQNRDLKSRFQAHLSETEQHITRLEEVFEACGQPAKAKACEAMTGLIEDGEELIQQDAGDSALIGAAQKVQRHEIEAYFSLTTWAEMLNQDEAADLLEASLDEENATDKKLSAIARMLHVSVSKPGLLSEPSEVPL